MQITAQKAEGNPIDVSMRIKKNRATRLANWSSVAEPRQSHPYPSRFPNKTLVETRRFAGKNYPALRRLGSKSPVLGPFVPFWVSVVQNPKAEAPNSSVVHTTPEFFAV